MSSATNKGPSLLDGASMNEEQLQTGPAGPQPANVASQKQSFLSKFSRSEVKSSRSIDKSTHFNKTSDLNNNSYTNTASKSNLDGGNPVKATVAASNSRSTPEVDSDKSSSKPLKAKTGLGGNLFQNRASKSFCETDTSEPTRGVGASTDLRRTNDNVDSSNNHADDDNDQVLPFWPSKIDATPLEPSMFQVYSLKDYSQVAGPTENVTSSTAGGRLLKSMSQDRKVDSRTKRMSECILTSQVTSDPKSKNQARQHRLPSMIGKISSTNLGIMGPATSVNSLLPQNKNPTLMNESRIDRMRKLFVSPLSLRGSTGGKSTQAHQASTHSRLSLQAGANMLNKPHHLMHAMYRTRVGVGPHYTRRSPMRQKPGSVRGFRVYGCPLSMANTMYPITCFGRPDIYKQQSVPYILARLCYFIEENSSQLTHEGIFRVSGNVRLMEKLKTLFDHLGDAPLESESVDVATSASMLKMYLRELPDPLIPTRMNYHFFTLAKKYSSILSKTSFDGSRAYDNLTTPGTSSIMNEASSMSDGQSTLDRQKIAFLRDLTKLIRKLPIENYNLLKYLACFLHRISLKQQSNKMSAEALGIVFGPNVFRIRSESYKGLKEQELSNQVMASVITNYKQIFDCEITDALGNLVKSEEFLHPNHDIDTSDAQRRASQSADINSLDKGAITAHASKKESAILQPTATTSTTYGYISKTRCSGHGGQAGYRYNDDEDGSDDEDANIDNDGNEGFDDEECDDESYSRTSDSGSYCSSMASESVESIYEGDVEGDQYDDDDEFALGSGSSSECGSETSYTPSSSHSDANPNEVELSSSNFSSNQSLTGARVGGNETNSTSVQKPCLVCKRRESAQLEANKIKEQIRVSNSNSAKDDSKDTNDVRKQDPSAETPSANEMNTEQNRLAGVKNSSRQSMRRKRVGDDLKKAPQGKFDITSQSKGLALTSQVLRPSRHSNHHQNRHDQRHGPLRRRSSSASSLLRISNRLDHVRKRSVGPDDYHGHRSRIHADRRKCNDSRSYNRRSRMKGHPTRKETHKLYNSRTQQTVDKMRYGTKSHSEWAKGDCYVPELIAMNMPSASKDDLIWNFVPQSFLGVGPDCERFYQLRSYNSDETLLRSHEYTASSSVEAASHARRRFSGQDYLNPNQESLLANINNEFQDISESYEGETSAYKTIEGDDLLDKTRRLDLTGVQSSVVSLLSDQLVSFKHSTLSLNDESTDPIVCQLKVIKDLIRALEKSVRETKTRGLKQEIPSHILQLVGDLETDDQLETLSTCCFDYLAAKNVLAKLEGSEDAADRPKIDLATQNRMMELLIDQVTELKKRYGNLKYIREHYYKHHHAKQRTRQVAESNEANAGEHAKDGERTVKQLDGQSVASDISSLGSTSHTTGTDLDKRAILNHKAELDTTLAADSCKFGSLCPVEFVFNIEKQLASRRRVGSRIVRLNDMTLAQLQSEKLELQKNLLRYEHWFGRPLTRSEFSLIGHLYERYRAVKIIKQQRQASG